MSRMKNQVQVGTMKRPLNRRRMFGEGYYNNSRMLLVQTSGGRINPVITSVVVHHTSINTL